MRFDKAAHTILEYLSLTNMSTLTSLDKFNVPLEF